MVKTNKKSLIAMIAMVVLLIASIAMGITGAWFTATENKDLGTGGTLKFGEVKITSSTGTSLTLIHNGSEVKVDGETLVMPGDKIKNASASFTVTTTDDCGFYYAIKSGENYYTISDGQLVAATEAAKVAKTEETLAFGDSNEVTIPTTTTNASQGQPYTLSNVYSGAYTLYVVQAANVADGAAAMDIIQGL